MEITDFVATRRADALLAGDYNSYRAQLSRKLHTLRKRLGQTTPKNKPYSEKPAVTAGDIAKDTNFVYVLIVLAERAWATAMHMKSVHSADPSTKGITGSTKRHIISRLNKATVYAKQLVDDLADRETSGATITDLLEARAYLACLLGAYWMEKQRWADCVRQYSVARVIYAALEKQSSRQTLRDLLYSTVDPSIRYAAYQLKLPRTTAVPSIAAEYFPADSEARAEVESIQVAGVKETDGMEVDSVAPEDLPRTISWRSRTVPLEDASISQALAAAHAAESELSSWLSSPEGQSAAPKDTAAQYDNVIIASQDAVDATKTAIDELLGEGVDQSDKRMQALQVTRTAVNYALVGWRVGRNRVLCGAADGLELDGRREEEGSGQAPLVGNEQSTGKRLTQLRERVVLYDSILQSLDSVQELPGVAGDARFMAELDGKQRYFRSLRCLSLGKSHAALSNTKNALALFARGLECLPKTVEQGDQEGTTAHQLLRLDISDTQLKSLATLLQSLVWQYQGIVEIERLSSQSEQEKKGTRQPPLIERLDEYSPSGRADLNNLVVYPPTLRPIPVKPLFFDVAWNYIDYPREGKKAVQTSQETKHEPAGAADDGKKEAKRGWFGFGRS